MKLAYIVYKPKFDLLLANFLKKVGVEEIIFLVPNPIEALRLKVNALDSQVIPLYDLPPVSPKPEDEALARRSIFYGTWPSDLQKRAASRVASLRSFLESFFRQQKFSGLMLSEKTDLSALTAGEVAVTLGLPTLYLGVGFFRGESLSASPLPLRVFYPEIWEVRLSSFSSVTPPGVDPLPKVNFYPEEMTYRSAPLLHSWYYKLRYLENRHFLYRHPDLFRKHRLWERLFRHLKKRYFKRQKGKTTEPDPPHPFVLLPLQGHEICSEVPSPFGFKDMLEVLRTIMGAFVETGLHHRFHLVVKEHPNRPGIVPTSLIREAPPWMTFRRYYNMQQLLEKASLVITYNSLSGFEALLKGKKVICLAPIFYNLKGLVMYPQHEEELLEYLKEFERFDPNWKKFEALCSFIWKFTDLKTRNFSRTKPSSEAMHLIAGRLFYLIRNRYLPPREWL